MRLENSSKYIYKRNKSEINSNQNSRTTTNINN